MLLYELNLVFATDLVARAADFVAHATDFVKGATDFMADTTEFRGMWHFGHYLC